MDFKKQVQDVHTLKNEKFRKKYLGGQGTHPEPPSIEYDILFNELAFQPDPFIFRHYIPAPHQPPNHRHGRAEFSRLSNREFEYCFVVDIT